MLTILFFLQMLVLKYYVLKIKKIKYSSYRVKLPVIIRIRLPFELYYVEIIVNCNIIMIIYCSYLSAVSIYNIEFNNVSSTNFYVHSKLFRGN